MEKNEKLFKIRLIPTSEKLWVYLGNLDSVKAQFKDADLEGEYFGCFFRSKNIKGKMIYVIYLSEWDLPLLVHELTHAIDYFSDEMELKNKELRAYFMDYCFDLIFKKFNKVGQDGKK